MTTTRVKITHGNTTVEVEAPLEQLEEAVKQVLAALKTEPTPQPQATQSSRRTMTCRTAVEELVSSGWMKTGRTLSEVVSELERRGFIYDSTAVAHVLLDLVRSGMLERVGEPRRYIYLESSRKTQAQTGSADSRRELSPSEVIS